jgi:hypothetical protein
VISFFIPFVKYLINHFYYTAPSGRFDNEGGFPGAASLTFLSPIIGKEFIKNFV